MKNITIADVAIQAKVSKSTVSQFLNKRYEYMSETTRLKIEQTIKELNYRPNIVARSLKQKSTFTVGVIVANILHSFSTQIIRAIENNFHEHGFHIIVCNADDEPEKERNYIEMLMAKQVDGIIIFPTGGNIDLYKSMIKTEFPIVFMDRTIDELEILPFCDNDKAATLAVDRFVESGYSVLQLLQHPLFEILVHVLNEFKGIKMHLNNINYQSIRLY